MCVYMYRLSAIGYMPTPYTRGQEEIEIQSTNTKHATSQPILSKMSCFIFFPLW